MYDIIVIGAGPAGLVAALYARRAGKTVCVLEKGSFGGQITYSPKVENIPGFLSVSGNEFAEKLIDQVINQGAEIEMETVTEIRDNGESKTVVTEEGEHEAKAVIIATGVKHRQTGLPNENELVGAGISYCAVCDGAFFKGQTVAVLGGGNSALQEAVLLSESCEKVYVVQKHHQHHHKDDDADPLAVVHFRLLRFFRFFIGLIRISGLIVHDILLHSLDLYRV